MFQFTTTTLVNSLKDYTTGLPLIHKEGDTVYVKRQGIYKLDDDHKICAYKTEGHDAWLDAIDLNELPDITAGDTDTNGDDKVYRLALYIRSIGNADPLFANDYVFKGKPVCIEFKVGSGETAATNVAKALAKVNSFGGDPILVPAKSVDDTTHITAVTEAPASDFSDAAYLVATNEYLRITKVVVEEFVPATATIQDHFKVLEDVTEDAVIVGAEGFGTFNHLEKDFRLPTAANLRWKRPLADEMPAAGVIYDEYILHYIVNRGQVAGLGGVGEQITSETTHVFWVQHSLASNFETELTNLGVEFIDMTNYGV